MFHNIKRGTPSGFNRLSTTVYPPKMGAPSSQQLQSTCCNDHMNCIRLATLHTMDGNQIRVVEFVCAVSPKNGRQFSKK